MQVKQIIRPHYIDQTSTKRTFKEVRLYAMHHFDHNSHILFRHSLYTPTFILGGQIYS